MKFSLQNFALSMQNQVLVIFFAGTPLSHAEAVLKVRVTRNARNLQKPPNVGVFTKFLTVFVYAKTEKRAIQKLSSLPSSFELRVICCKKIVSSSLWKLFLSSPLKRFHEKSTTHQITFGSKLGKYTNFLHNNHELAILCRRPTSEHQNGDARGHCWSWRKYMGHFSQFQCKLHCLISRNFTYFVGNRPAEFTGWKKLRPYFAYLALVLK